MGRVRMVTRTIVATKALALVADFENNTLTKEVLTIGGKYDTPDDKEFQKAIKKAYPNTVVAKVLELTYEETLYGIEESEFLKIARVLPPRNGNTDADADEEE